MKRTVASLGEFGIIRELLRRLPSFDVGDDATVLPRPNKKILVTTDLLQEGVHFERRWASWSDVAYKALQVNLSDIAAMGGRPEYYWLTLSLPRNFQVAELRQLRSGLKRASRPYQLRCAGGDTNHSKAGGVALAITLMGQVGQRVVRRSGARVGDDIYVTGTLGESGLGLILMQRHKHLVPQYARYCRRQTQAKARVQAGQKLGALGVHAMIDVSDGLCADLGHVVKASDVGAELDLAALRPVPMFRKLCEQIKQPWENLVLSGGEDYELLFCASRRFASRIQSLSRRLKLPMTKIGRVVSGRSIVCFDEAGRKMQLRRLGFNHFC